MWRNVRALMILGMLAGLVPVLPVGVALADDAVVGSGSLASCTEGAFDTALAAAQTNGGGTITFNCGGPATITFTDSKVISNPNTVIIDGANQITLDGGDATKFFLIDDGATLDLRNLTIENGRHYAGGAIDNDGTTLITGSTLRYNQVDQQSTNRGGAIYNNGGDVTITSSTIASNDSADDGGAIYNGNGGTVTITNSTFNANTAGSYGGAIYNDNGDIEIVTSTFYNNLAGNDGGAIYNYDEVTVTSSTLTSNSADSDGGAIYHHGGNLAITFSTITRNDALSGAGGIYFSDPADITGTIVADNGVNCSDANNVSDGWNLSDDDSCDFDQPSDIVNSTAINLGELQDNGGPTWTILPAAGSDAIDNAAEACPAEDQRGETRPSGAACDIGSVEVQPSAASTYTLCVDLYSGQLTSPVSNQCAPPYQVELETPSDNPLTFCISNWTGAVTYRFNRPCGTNYRTHVVPDNGDLLTCVSLYTGRHRAVRAHSQCTAAERPNTVPAA